MEKWTVHVVATVVGAFVGLVAASACAAHKQCKRESAALEFVNELVSSCVPSDEGCTNIEGNVSPITNETGGSQVPDEIPSDISATIGGESKNRTNEAAETHVRTRQTGPVIERGVKAPTGGTIAIRPERRAYEASEAGKGLVW
jgi:hypothetical protein